MQAARNLAGQVRQGCPGRAGSAAESSSAAPRRSGWRTKAWCPFIRAAQLSSPSSGSPKFGRNTYFSTHHPRSSDLFGHQAIVDALLANNGCAAASAMHDHVANSKKQLLKGLERVERPAGRPG